jgi:microcystin-dependent protein
MRRSILLFFFLTSLLRAQQTQTLLPFNARLLGSKGEALTNGVRLVEIRIYDQPSGGTPVWPGELHHTSINGGLVSLYLGTKTPFDGVDFNKVLYVEVTVDENGDDAITAADAPIVPRQLLLPKAFAQAAASARSTEHLAGADWTAIMTGPDPRDTQTFIQPAKLQPGTLDGSIVAGATIGGAQIAPRAIDETILAPGAVGLTALKNEILASLVPPGVITPYGGDWNTIPAGWLNCDGSAVSTNDYPALFAAIGRTWGTPDFNGDKFNLPDFRGRFPRGVSAGTARDPDAATRVKDANLFSGPAGDAVATVEDEMIGSHTHPITQSAGDHLLGVFVQGSVNQGWDNPVSFNNYTAYNDTETFTLGDDGFAGHETRPKNVGVLYLIKY